MNNKDLVLADRIAIYLTENFKKLLAELTLKPWDDLSVQMKTLKWVLIIEFLGHGADIIYQLSWFYIYHA